MLSSTVAVGAVNSEALIGACSAAFVGTAVVAVLGGVITLVALRSRQRADATAVELETVAS